MTISQTRFPNQYLLCLGEPCGELASDVLCVGGRTRGREVLSDSRISLSWGQEGAAALLSTWTGRRDGYSHALEPFYRDLCQRVSFGKTALKIPAQAG